ncbi:hypothetical protein Poly51_21960 [Rubripirellula tenax]|uniref:Uncharacterized protein n=1 Tax=Rubripirellula tenax TaxID=2528015 RepID=A0A5C6FD61_9BACT|nr:hypothetical protein [Rubripirellula tenax]TWU59408.1 hypothetical protein Poly51_21960 [Rubripirellula tenax]
MNETTTLRRDYGFLAIAALVIVNAIWLLLMPWVPAIAESTLRRFHLASSSFGVWAVQFPIPSMYNFANRTRVDALPPGLIDPILANPLSTNTDQRDAPERRYINHFPIRVLTFADTRWRNLHDGKDRWYELESTYRGQRIETRLHAKPDADVAGGFVLVRQSVKVTR